MFYAHPQALVALDSPAAQPSDVAVTCPGGFAATTWTLTALTPAGAAWLELVAGGPAVSLDIRKSALDSAVAKGAAAGVVVR